MAGNIVVGEDPLPMWQAANWAFDFVIRELRSFVTPEGVVASELGSFSNSHVLKFVDITDWSDADRDDLASAVDGLAALLRDLGPEILYSPEFFPGMLAKVEERNAERNRTCRSARLITPCRIAPVTRSERPTSAQGRGR